MRGIEWLVAALLAIAFAPAVLALAGVWASLPYYSHGFLVPIVAAWIARQQAPADFPRSTPRAPRFLGLGGVALLLYAAGLAAGEVSAQGVALVLTVVAGVGYLGGTPALRALAFPLCFLLFMVPVPAPWLTPLIVKLQLLVSGAAVAVLQACGFPVERTGNVLALASGETLFVDEACSGITSLVTLLPLGLVLAYFTERRFWRRAALVVAVLPAAFLGNLLRVVSTVWAASVWGAARATGNALHESAGVLTFAVACLLLIGLGALMRRGESAA